MHSLQDVAYWASIVVVIPFTLMAVVRLYEAFEMKDIGEAFTGVFSFVGGLALSALIWYGIGAPQGTLPASFVLLPF